MINCALCDTVIDIDEEDLDEGDEITCDDCGATLQVVSKNPLELEPAAEGEEDEEEDDDLDGNDDEDLEAEDEEDEDEEEWK